MDKLKIAPQNVRGLETSDKKHIVKRFLKWAKIIDIFLIQEVKVVGFSLEITLKCIWKDVVTLATKHLKGKGGTTILIRPN